MCFIQVNAESIIEAGRAKAAPKDGVPGEVGGQPGGQSLGGEVDMGAGGMSRLTPQGQEALAAAMAVPPGMTKKIGWKLT